MWFSSCSQKYIEGWLKICTLFWVYSHIWLNYLNLITTSTTNKISISSLIPLHIPMFSLHNMLSCVLRNVKHQNTRALSSSFFKLEKFHVIRNSKIENWCNFLGFQLSKVKKLKIKNCVCVYIFPYGAKNVEGWLKICT